MINDGIQELAVYTSSFFLIVGLDKSVSIRWLVPSKHFANVLIYGPLTGQYPLHSTREAQNFCTILLVYQHSSFKEGFVGLATLRDVVMVS